MKLNIECIRDLLLTIEEELVLEELLDATDIQDVKRMKKYNQDDITYTALKLKEAGYINFETTYGGDHLFDTIAFTSITWNGHQYLDTIRDNEVWKKTKNIVSTFSSVSATMIENVASNVLTNLISKQMNLS